VAPQPLGLPLYLSPVHRRFAAALRCTSIRALFVQKCLAPQKSISRLSKPRASPALRRPYTQDHGVAGSDVSGPALSSQRVAVSLVDESKLGLPSTFQRQVHHRHEASAAISGAF
jgi:hypothetical protein